MAKIDGAWIADIFQQEVPSGDINGANTDFTLANAPHSSNAVMTFLNGIPQVLGTEVSVSGTTISFTNPPAPGQHVYCFYVKRKP